MKPLTLSAHNICAVAVEHFAAHGYDASSLNEIAVGAGMRKNPRLHYVPCRLSLVPALFSRAMPPDVVLLHTSMPRHGVVSLGIEVNEDYVRERAQQGHRWRNPVWRHVDGSFAEWCIIKRNND